MMKSDAFGALVSSVVESDGVKQMVDGLESGEVGHVPATTGCAHATQDCPLNTGRPMD